MCIGRPMQVISTNRLDRAICRDAEVSRSVDILLTPEAVPGDWLLVFLGASRQIIDASTAALMLDALDALAAVARGEAADGYFPDLSGREPQLPAHMETARRSGATKV